MQTHTHMHTHARTSYCLDISHMSVRTVAVVCDKTAALYIRAHTRDEYFVFDRFRSFILSIFEWNWCHNCSSDVLWLLLLQCLPITSYLTNFIVISYHFARVDFISLFHCDYSSVVLIRWWGFRFAHYLGRVSIIAPLHLWLFSLEYGWCTYELRHTKSFVDHCN